MVIPKVGIVDGKVVVEGGGVKFEAPISNKAGAGTVTVTGPRTISGGGGRQSIDPIIVAAEKARVARAAAARAATKAAAEKALIAKTIAAGRARIAAQQKASRIKLTRKENLSLMAREDMRITALARGRGFSRREGEQFIRARGGSISGLRSAHRKGFRITAPKEMMKEEKKLFPEVTQEQIKAQLGEKLTGLSRLSASTRREAERLADKISEGKKLTSSEKARALFFQFAIPVQETLTGIVSLPGGIANLAKNPKEIKNLPKKFFDGLKEEAVEITGLAKVSPGLAIARIGGNLVGIKVVGQSVKVVGKLSKTASIKISPFVKKPKGGTITISTTTGKTVLKVGGTVKKIQEPLRKQAKIAGKRVTAVSAQADRLVNFIRTKRVVRKPIPGEANFSLKIKRLLKRFDEGKITKNELIRLQKEVPVLERSFFADPRGRFRPSRLGLGAQKDATLLDILKGDFTFKTPKPQILVFDNIKVAKFPKNLKDIEKALKGGKTLTSSQAKRLLDWQSKKTGKFKPIGALSKEPEITLAPGEIIKKVRKRGTALINGKRVSIVEVKVVKPTSLTKKLIKKSKDGKATPAELKKLNSRLKKETGFDSVISRRTARVKPRARIPKRISKTPKRVARKQTKVQRAAMLRNLAKARAVRLGEVAKRPGRVAARPTKRAARPKKVTRLGRVARRVGKPVKKTIVPPKKFKRGRTKTKPKKPVQVFDVFGKSRGKFVKLNTKPLTRADALSKGAFAIDRTTARTFKIAPKGKSKKPGALLKGEKNYFKRQGFKLREVRIKRGRKFQLKNKYIEKTKFGIDTKSEKSGLTIAKLLKQRRKAKKTISPKRKQPLRSSVRKKNIRRVVKSPIKTKRRITPTQRKILLKKARAVKKKLQRRNK